MLSGDYEVSNFGRVRRARPGRRTHAGRVMTPTLGKIGYLTVSPTIARRNTRIYVHQLVARAFIGPCPTAHEVNHRDGCKTNNRATNLEYVTHAGNMGHAARTGLAAHGTRVSGAKLDEVRVIELRARRAAGASWAQLEREFGVAKATARAAAFGQNWRRVV